MDIYFLVVSVVKIIAIMGFIYGMLWVLGHSSKWVKVVGIVAAFGIVQLALSLQFGDFKILTDYDRDLLFQACAMTMVALGLNLIYGFNGQFSLGQWGFYGLGAYCSADITYRWYNGDASGLLVVGLGVTLAGAAIITIFQLLKKYKGVPVLSQFTLYLLGVVLAVFIAVMVGNAISSTMVLLMGTSSAPGVLNSPLMHQVIFFFSIIFAGLFAAEVSFLFGLPVFTLGSDYFGIATLGFSIVIYTLMTNSDTILPFPEMKGGRGMIGIEKMTTWFWAFGFMVLVIIIMRNLIHSGVGRSIKAVREDETAARAMGINVPNVKLLAFVIGSLFAGLGGAVYAHFIGFLSPTSFGFLKGFDPLIVVVFGGLGSMTGTITASFGWFFFLEGLLRVLLGQMGTEAPTWRFVLYPITLLLLMLLRPKGLLGASEWGFLKAPTYGTKKADKSVNDSTPEPSTIK